MFKLDPAKSTFKGQRKYSDDSEEKFEVPKYTGTVFSVPAKEDLKPV